MGRPKKDPVTIEHPPVDDAAVPRDLATLDQLAAERSTAIARVSEEFGVSLPAFDVDLYFNHVTFLSGQVSELLLQQGVWLIALKEALPHGEFQAELQKRAGMSYRSAAVIMQATRRLATEGGKKFLANVQQAAGLTKTRLLELAVNMDEGELDALADGEEVGGHNREEYLQMSRSELLAALRRKDADLESGAQQLEDVEKKLKAKKSREKKEAPQEAAVRAFEHAAIEAAGEAAKLLNVDLEHAFAETYSDTAPQLTAAQSDDVTAAYVAALRRVAQVIATAADRLGTPVEDLFRPDDGGLMPEDFQ